MSDDVSGSRLPLERTLDSTLGVEVVEQGPDFLRGRIAVTDAIRQPYGIVHGGALCAIAESLASMGTALGVMGDGRIALGQELNASYMRPIGEGHVNALARVRRRGRTAWNWEVEITDDDDRLCTLLRLTIAVREGSAATGPARPDPAS
jgi:1,4-dihydroxy-2-naphthoyl-CoA hydrolase